LPILRPALIASYILSFARSLSETGATFIVAGLFENGPVFLQNLKNEYAAGVISQASYEGATVFASLILIVVSLSIFAFIRAFGPRLRLPIKGIWPSFERKLSYAKAEASRNSITLVVFVIIILLPSLFVALPAFQALFNGTIVNVVSGSGIWSDYWQSLALSYALAGIVTLLSFVIGLPMAVMIARKRFGKLTSTVFDILINVPLIVPSIALGVSLKFFWQSFAFVPEFLLLVFAHLAITYPYFVRSMTAAVVIVNWVKQVVPATPSEIGLGCGILILLSLVILLLLRLATRGKRSY
jgi:thiamine transport system permease protein